MSGQGAGHILVVGGGISGITAAVESAEVGYRVTLLERQPYLGGRVAQNNRYFPKLCPPYCGLEINFRRIRRNPRIEVLTLAQVKEISGVPGNYDVEVHVSPRYVNQKCTACGMCIEVCPVERRNPFNYGMDATKAIYLPHDLAMPFRYVIDSETCLGKECSKCVEVCRYGAIDLDMKDETRTLNVQAVIWATGWVPYDVGRIDYNGFGRIPNVITNVMMERMASPNGPTGGKVLRPSDGGVISTVVFVQCAGSRDVNHLPYCSGVCCLASLKQAIYIREQYPEAEVYIFYIDLRALGRHEDLLSRVMEDEKVHLVKGKVADISKDPEGEGVVVLLEDVDRGESCRVTADVAVLAAGMVPSTQAEKIPAEVQYDEYGFALDSGGVIPVGCVRKPVDVSHCVQDSTGAVLKAIQTSVRR